MCLPALATAAIGAITSMSATTAMTALAVATTAAGVVSQVQSAKQQQKAINAQAVENKTEINQQASAETNDRLRQARVEQSRIKVAAGEAGLQLGGSVDLLLKDSLLQGSLAAGRLETNRQSALKNNDAEAASMLSRATHPTILGAGLQIASAGAQGYAAGQSMQINRKTAQTNAGTH